MYKKYLLIVGLLLQFFSSYGQVPFISTVSPAKGEIGSQITIDGYFFGTNASQNDVYFGGVKATILSATDKKIVVTVPKGNAYDFISVFNRSSFRYGKSLQPFVTTFPSANSFSFADMSPKTTTIGPYSASSAFADLDGDGLQDEVVVSFSYNTISIIKNNAKPGILSTTSFGNEIILATGAKPSLVKLADINGDGKPDIIITNGNESTVSVFQNKMVSGNWSAASFAPKVDFVTGTDPIDLTIGDFNGDGKIDIATANQTGSNVSIFENISGTGDVDLNFFAKKQDFALGAIPFSIASADFTNDGHIDIVTANSNNTVTVLENTLASLSTTLSFATAKSFTVGTGPTTVRVSDIDDDGKLDLVTCNAQSNTVSVLLNESTFLGLSFGAKSDFATGTRPTYMTLGDIDGNGMVDIVTSNQGTILSDYSIGVLRNVSTFGKASFVEVVKMGTNNLVGAIDMVDLDLDGRLDLFVSQNGGSFILKNNPTLPPIITSISSMKGKPGDEIIINGQNFNLEKNDNVVYFAGLMATVNSATREKLTVIVPQAVSYGQISVLNKETQRLTKSSTAFIPIFAGKESIKSTDFTDEIAATGSQYASKVVVGDLDNDGRPDVVYNSVDTKQVKFGKNTPDMGKYYTLFNLEGTLEAGNQPSFIDLADMDGDGLLDIVACNSGDNNVSIFRNTSVVGTISFAPKVTFNFSSSNGNLGNMLISDLNNDGKLDILVYGNHIEFLQNNSSVGSLNLALASVSLPSLNNADRFVLIDLDFDGKPELLASSVGKVMVLGNTSLKEKISFNSGFEITASLLGRTEIADIDQDGKMDVVVTAYKEVYALLNRYTVGAGPLNKTHLDFQKIITTDRELSALKISDMDGDGKLDIVTTSEYEKTISIFKNTSSGSQLSFAFRVDLNARYAPVGLCLADIDLDNKPDIVLAEKVLFAYLNKPQTLLQSTPPVINSLPQSAQAGTEIELTGTGFNAQSALNEVLFGSIPAKINASTATKITVVVPASAVYSKVAILNKENQLTGYSKTYFTTTFNSKNYFSDKDFKAVIKLPKDYHTDYGDYLGLDAEDMDGDSKSDLVLHYTDANLIYRNTLVGGNKLSATAFAPKYVHLTGRRTGMPTVKDLNGNGRPEIIRGEPVVIIDNRSVAGKLETVNTSFYSYYGDKVTAADIDMDGKPEIIGLNDDNVNGYESVCLMKNISQGINSFFLQSINFTQNIQSSTVSVNSEDLDADGKPEIAVLSSGYNKSEIEIFLNTAVQGYITNTTIVSKLQLEVTGQVIKAKFADINADGKSDLITLSVDGTLGLLQNITTAPGALQFAAPVYIKLDEVWRYYDFDIGDIDGDGQVDLAVGSSKEYLQLLRNFGLGNNISTSTFRLVARIPMATAQKSVKLVDFDADGRFDIAVHNGEQVFLIPGINSSYPYVKLSEPLVYHISLQQEKIIDANVLASYPAQNISAAEISIKTNYNPLQDILGFHSSTATGDITASFDVLKGVLKLTGGATNTASNWQAALRNIFYKNPTIKPDTAGKEISFQLFDGGIEGNKETLKLQVLVEPLISSFTPTIAIKDVEVTINGSYFIGATAVSFGGAQAKSFKVLATGKITAIVDATAKTGEVSVVTPLGKAVKTGFEFVPPPKLTPIGPITAFDGEQIILKTDIEPNIAHTWRVNGSNEYNTPSNSLVAKKGGTYMAIVGYKGYFQTSEEVQINMYSPLPINNFKISSVGISCKGSSNGVINIQTVNNYLNYTAQISKGASTTIHVFSNGTLAVGNLAAGTYHVCITIENHATFEYCTDVVIAEPVGLKLVTTASVVGNNVVLSFSGSDIYHVELNGKMTTTADSTLTLPLQNGENIVKLSSNLPCQGVIEKRIYGGSTILVYPNPVKDLLKIKLSDFPINQQPTIDIFDVMGKLMYHGIYVNGDFNVDVSSWPLGVYILKTTFGNDRRTTNFIKN